MSRLTELMISKAGFKGKSIDIVYFVYQIDSPFNYKEFIVMFGNKEHGFTCDREDLVELWARCIRWSKYNSFGDVTLLRNGKLIRGMRNAEVRILNKDNDYNYVVTKYND